MRTLCAAVCPAGRGETGKGDEGGVRQATKSPAKSPRRGRTRREVAGSVWQHTEHESSPHPSGEASCIELLGQKNNNEDEDAAIQRIVGTLAVLDGVLLSLRLVHRLRPFESGERWVNSLSSLLAPGHQPDRRENAHGHVGPKLQHRVLERGGPLVLVVLHSTGSHVPLTTRRLFRGHLEAQKSMLTASRTAPMSPAVEVSIVSTGSKRSMSNPRTQPEPCQRG